MIIDKTEFDKRLLGQKQVVEAADIAQRIATEELGDSDILGGRCLEYSMASKLDHIVSDNRSGSDGFDSEGNSYEYKTTKLLGYNSDNTYRTRGFRYGNITKLATYAQTEECAKEKTLADNAHYWGVRGEAGCGFKVIYKVESEAVAEGLKRKLPKAYSASSSNKDPRIAVTLSTSDVKGIRVVYGSEQAK